jgi:hypothetical protein
MSPDPIDESSEVSPARVRIGLVMVAIVMVVAVGVITTVTDPAARFLFAAILAVGLFQTWRIFRRNRRR